MAIDGISLRKKFSKLSSRKAKMTSGSEALREEPSLFGGGFELGWDGGLSGAMRLYRVTSFRYVCIWIRDKRYMS